MAAPAVPYEIVKVVPEMLATVLVIPVPPSCVIRMTLGATDVIPCVTTRLVPDPDVATPLFASVMPRSGVAWYDEPEWKEIGAVVYQLFPPNVYAPAPNVANVAHDPLEGVPRSTFPMTTQPFTESSERVSVPAPLKTLLTIETAPTWEDPVA